MQATTTQQSGRIMQHAPKPSLHHPSRLHAVHCRRTVQLRKRGLALRSHNVEIEHNGVKHQLSVPDGESILDVALSNGLELPHDCKMGVCMTCPAKMVSGKVDQSGAMISEDVAEKGYALLCVAQPKEDCKIITIAEEELLDLQMNH